MFIEESNITQTIQSIQSAVEEAELNSSYKIDKVVVGIAGQHIAYNIVII